MKKILKFIGYTALIILVAILFWVGVFVYGMVGAVSDIADSAMQEDSRLAQGQRYQVHDDRIVIVTELIPVEQVVLNGFDLCEPDGVDYDFGYTSMCGGSNCRSTISFGAGETVPATLNIHQEREDGSCVPHVIEDVASKIQITDYEAPIKITDEMMAKFIGPKNDEGFEKAENSTFNGHSSFGFGGERKITLSYPRKPTGFDVFTFDGVPVVVGFRNQ